MLRRLSLRDVAIVTELDLDLEPGYTALTGETGAGKSILIEALQLALGSRADAMVVREGAARAEVSVEFDVDTQALGIAHWLEDGGFEVEGALLLRRQIDAQGKSRAWINGRAATLTQLRELAEQLVDIHGQHAWQSLTRPDTVRELLDAWGRIDTRALTAAWTTWRQARQRLSEAQSLQAQMGEQRERLQWRLGEIDKLSPAAQEWEQLNQDHTRLSHAQSILDAAGLALAHCVGDDDGARRRVSAAVQALQPLAPVDTAVANALDVLQSVLAQLDDVEHTLSGVLHHTELDPRALHALDERLSSWVSLARKFRVAPETLHATQSAWRAELQALEAAADLDALLADEAKAKKHYDAQAETVGRSREAAAPQLGEAVTAAMQELGMAGGRFEVALLPLDEPQAHGYHQVEFRVAGHAGATPRPLAKVASGGELSRLALAISVCTSELGTHGTLIFDEVDAGVGGAVAQTVGRMMQRLGADRQVLTVTHLAQVAAYADTQWVVSKSSVRGGTSNRVEVVEDDARVAEIARMLGAQAASKTGRAHAEEMLQAAQASASGGSHHERRRA